MELCTFTVPLNIEMLSENITRTDRNIQRDKNIQWLLFQLCVWSVANLTRALAVSQTTNLFITENQNAKRRFVTTPTHKHWHLYWWCLFSVLCPICGNSFKNKNSLKNHKSVYHRKPKVDADPFYEITPEIHHNMIEYQ